MKPMKTGSTLATLAVALLLVAAPAPAQDPEVRELQPPPLPKLLADLSESVVTVKCVLKVRIDAMGQSQEQEQNMEVRGVLVNATGLVLLANSHFDGGIPAALRRMLGDQLQVKATPTDLKVMFGNEVEELDAQLVARDSNLDLAFVQIMDLGDRQIRSIDLTPGVAKLDVGHEVYAVSRMSRGFDCAPALHRFFVTARLEKPRKMWAVTGDDATLAHPVVDRFGQPVGVLSIQEGSEGVGGEMSLMSMGNIGDNLLPVILPLDQVARTMKAAAERAQEALQAAAEEEPDSTDTPDEPETPETPEEPDGPTPPEEPTDD
jgi:hypothetical protein